MIDNRIDCIVYGRGGARSRTPSTSSRHPGVPRAARPGVPVAAVDSQGREEGSLRYLSLFGFFVKLVQFLDGSLEIIRSNLLFPFRQLG